MLTATVRWGKGQGIQLTPHKFRDGTYRASKSKFGPHETVRNWEALIPWMRRGYSIRMSPKDSANRRGPSLITPARVKGW